LENINCDAVLEQLSEFIDDETRAELCEAIKQHLALCKDCRIQVDSVRKTIVLYQHSTPVELPAGLSEKLRSAMTREYGASR
jgi:hypothetical protein